MTNLRRLTVSLTKHGAHKVATLLQQYPAQDLFSHLDDYQLHIHINDVQAHKNLSVTPDGNLPSYWETAKQEGQQQIRICVLLAIVFTHHRLISTLVHSRCRYGVGIIKRGEWLGGKEYTNLACIFRELSFMTKENGNSFEFDISEAFASSSNASLLQTIIVEKLVTAGFDQEKEDFLSVCLAHRFNMVFGLSQQEFANWIDQGQLIPNFSDNELEETADDENELPSTKFFFQPGHLERAIDELKLSQGKKRVTIHRLHNKIQNVLYKRLSAEYGASNVGTEQPYGGTIKIDVVVQHNDDTFTFYEIKTDRSVRRCIRQALSQLLEYAYWPDREQSKQLVITAPKPITNQAAVYLKHLRRMFSMPIYYQSFDDTTDEFSSLS